MLLVSKDETWLLCTQQLMYSLSPIVGAVELISAGYQTDQSSATNDNSGISPHLKAIGYLALVLDTLAAVSYSSSLPRAHRLPKGEEGMQCAYTLIQRRNSNTEVKCYYI